jgi:hypothetical protein
MTARKRKHASTSRVADLSADDTLGVSAFSAATGRSRPHTYQAGEDVVINLDYDDRLQLERTMPQLAMRGRRAAIGAQHHGAMPRPDGIDGIDGADDRRQPSPRGAARQRHDGLLVDYEHPMNGYEPRCQGQRSSRRIWCPHRENFAAPE